jgi:integrase/recombinase XerD
MNELIERFMMYLAAERGLSTAYQLSVRQTLEMLSRWLEEQKVSIADVQTETLQGFLANLQQSSHSRSSCRVMMVHVRIFFRWLQSRGFLAQDPAALLETPRPELRLPETMDEKIMAELIESVSPEEEPYGSRDRAILELLYGCGLRVSELISLRLDAYDAQGTVPSSDRQRRQNSLRPSRNCCDTSNQPLLESHEAEACTQTILSSDFPLTFRKTSHSRPHPPDCS